MNKLVLYSTILLFLFVNQSHAQQKLVYNGDFEEYDSCPTNPSFPGDLQVEHCTGWTAPRKLGTSDYFNVCNNPINGGLAGVPQNLSGYQYPLNGNGYCGFFAWSLDQNGTSYREYLQTKLLKPLEGGKIYSLTFYVSYYGGHLSVEKIGALFSNNSFTEQTASPIVANPQIINKNGILSDSLNWMKIQGKFISSGNEEFLTFGYFVDSLQVFDTLNTYNDPLCGMESYYFVDGVELIETAEELPNIFTPNNDGKNDFFITEFWVEKFSVLNRWGNLISVTNNSQPYWDGRDLRGNEMVEGMYFYIIEIGEFKQTGFIQLIR
ncbi:gliding motility-associated C-terminal domain-containing protein [Fluviicola sp.]|uniref:T9SS type B sorting domain-containing protein n=1 Tax=Fluviicola sp. TaxID=1917219 RepID=UPI003D26B3B6